MRKFHLICVGLIMLCLRPVQAEEIRIAVGLWIPPYVIKDENRGIEYDVLKEVLARTGRDMIAVYVPLGRTLLEFSHGSVDGIMSTGNPDLPGCYTDSHITYWNYAFSLKEQGLKIETVADLEGLSVVSFQNARKYLGSDFAAMAAANPRYREIANQQEQLKLLFLRRVDVIVADRYIFQWFRKDPEVTRILDTSREVTYHELFEPSHFRSVFRDLAVCREFNAALKAFRSDGRYDAILRQYGVRNLGS